MNSKPEKYERCVKKVKVKLPKNCAKNGYSGKGCYNPWAVCQKSVYGFSEPAETSPPDLRYDYGFCFLGLGDCPSDVLEQIRKRRLDILERYESGEIDFDTALRLNDRYTKYIKQKAKELKKVVLPSETFYVRRS